MLSMLHMLIMGSLLYDLMIVVESPIVIKDGGKNDELSDS